MRERLFLRRLACKRFAILALRLPGQQIVHFMKNVSMLGGALLSAQFGAGPWSLDSRRG